MNKLIAAAAVALLAAALPGGPASATGGEDGLSNVAVVEQYDCYRGRNQLWFIETGYV